MSEITRRDLLKALGASGVVLGGMSANITGLDKLIRGDASNLGIELDKSYGADLIKPGTIIDSGNYMNFSQLKDLLPEHQYLRLKKGATVSDFPPIHIVPTRKLRLSKTEEEWKEKNRDVVKLDTKTNTLINWKAGRPFPEPKNMNEVTWNFIHRHWEADSMHCDYTFHVLDKYNRTKSVSFSLWMRLYKGRTTVPPVPEFPNNPDNVLWKQSMVFSKPYDAAGFGMLRTRYESLTKDDDAWAYMPAIRRVRRFTGADVQDPLFGTDIIMDDFAGFLQKIDFKTIVPTKMEDGLLLNYAYIPEATYDGHKLKWTGRQLFYPSWEIRPVYKLTFEIKDPNYTYSKRIVWVDKETCLSNYMEAYDQKGNLFRTWFSGYWWSEEGGHQWAYCEAEDWVNGSKTHIICKSKPYNTSFPDDILTIQRMKTLGR